MFGRTRIRRRSAGRIASGPDTTDWVFYRSLPSQFAIAGLFATVGLLVTAVTATVLHLVSIVYM
ncbi:hypothetical protein HSBGL_1787 [Halapricum desulfuricans]|uniref:Uncharacterized protein n=1 Tax=Halapricum desulfuricans TaxID=2841257 RepID=A0A897NHY3_9EURY|nr:hypothetical protein [Halapricum desulfuricans]QSG12198.1 hypothetical protein HSBGL_1787 [Halapricum desulfuricans]